MIRLTDNLISLQEAAKLVPGRDGGHVCYETIRKWAKFGIRGVKLETLPIGGRLRTTPEAMQRFFEQLAGEPLHRTPESEAEQARIDRESLRREFGI